jgi:hypothetical protein
MFFNNLKDIPEIASRAGCSIFVVSDREKIEIKNAFILTPTTKTIISIDQVHEILDQLTVKQTQKQYILIRPADKLGDEAANAILKNLEEPNDNIHFVLVTEKPSKLLPTILSRAAIYIYRDGTDPLKNVDPDEKKRAVAKELMAAEPKDLVRFAEKLTAKKDGVREYVLDILGLAIEMSYRTYFVSQKRVYLTKATKFIVAYENIARNGHIKLHLVADLI